MCQLKKIGLGLQSVLITEFPKVVELTFTKIFFDLIYSSFCFTICWTNSWRSLSKQCLWLLFLFDYFLLFSWAEKARKSRNVRNLTFKELNMLGTKNARNLKRKEIVQYLELITCSFKKNFTTYFFRKSMLHCSDYLDIVLIDFFITNFFQSNFLSMVLLEVDFGTRIHFDLFKYDFYIIFLSWLVAASSSWKGQVIFNKEWKESFVNRRKKIVWNYFFFVCFSAQIFQSNIFWLFCLFFVLSGFWGLKIILAVSYCPLYLYSQTRF